jgi:gag-polypeptide of LTR copia-type
MEHDRLRVILPKLASDGGNWVVYRDRIIWAMQASTINDHIITDTPSAAYLALGDRDNLTPELWWAKEENHIKQVLCSTLPDTAFNQIKSVTSIKDVWATLKRVYEERSKALVVDIMQRFRNKRCEETESVRTHFEALADL